MACSDTTTYPPTRYNAAHVTLLTHCLRASAMTRSIAMGARMPARPICWREIHNTFYTQTLTIYLSSSAAAHHRDLEDQILFIRLLCGLCGYGCPSLPHWLRGLLRPHMLF